jgi:2-polyprenyl-6-methoxyphenol hydroxylase-like FAD-dependent oxidoreductase
MTIKRTAHVIGGGIGGLAVAACLAQRQWDVTVHERSSELREIGAGIMLKENSLRVLEELQCIDTMLGYCNRIKHTFINDRPGHELRRVAYGDERVYTILREDLHRELANVARRWGTTVLLNSRVKSVTPAGDVFTEDGQSYRADLIVGADGIGSLVRAQAGLERSAGRMRNGSTRILVPRKPTDTMDTSGEYWREHNRVLVAPVSQDIMYMCASSREDDTRGTALPFDAAYWSALFPELAHFFSRVDKGVHHVHGRVKVTGWQRGHIAILGDAAHGQPPNLGQGAGMAIKNGQALAHALDREGDVQAALARWEREHMKLTLQVQNWSIGWDHVMHDWPLTLLPLRSALVLALNKLPATKRHWKSLYRGVSQDEVA